jgi:CDP-4-dehydro-6-deoxyglucose reductase
MNGYLVSLKRSRRSFIARADEPILCAATRNGILLRSSCRTGRCGVCFAELIAGKVSCYGLTLVAGESLAATVPVCIAIALSDIQFDVDE